MPNQFTDITSQGLGGSLTSSLRGLVFGLIFGVVSVPLLVWNEHRAIQTARALEETGSMVATVSTDKVDPAHEGKPVYFTGKADTAQTLKDPQFGITAAALKLERNAEIFQWKEKEQSETRDKYGGGKETITTYTYAAEWSDAPVNSSNFKHPEGHMNTSATAFVGDFAVSATDAHVGAFAVTGEVLAKLSANQAVQLDEKSVEDAPPTLKPKLHLLSATELFLGKDSQNPAIGDQRVSFKSLPPTEISVVAEQAGGGLHSHLAKSGATVLLVEPGVVGVQEMFATAKSTNNTITWLVRLGGFILVFIGFFSLFRPFIALAGILPFLGTLAEIGAGFFAFIAAIVVTTITVAVAWFAVRPMLSLGLLAAAGVGFYLLHSRHKAVLQKQVG